MIFHLPPGIEKRPAGLRATREPSRSGTFRWALACGSYTRGPLACTEFTQFEGFLENVPQSRVPRLACYIWQAPAAVGSASRVRHTVPYCPLACIQGQWLELRQRSRGPGMRSGVPAVRGWAGNANTKRLNNQQLWFPRPTHSCAAATALHLPSPGRAVLLSSGIVAIIGQRRSFVQCSWGSRCSERWIFQIVDSSLLQCKIFKNYCFSESQTLHFSIVSGS